MGGAQHHLGLPTHLGGNIRFQLSQHRAGCGQLGEQGFRQAAETLRKNYQKELSLADLLAEAHMSKSYFLRLFRRYIGTTPYNYLVNFRITQAKELLVLTDHSVSEIAQEVGFGDASNFSTRFAKATGQSPLKYRKSALKPQEGTR